MFALLFIGYDFLKAAGTAKFLNLGSNVGALFMFMYVGQVNYVYGFIMGVAQIAGGIAGSRFAIKKRKRVCSRPFHYRNLFVVSEKLV